MVHVELKSQFFSYAEGVGGGLGLCWDGTIGYTSSPPLASTDIIAVRLTVRDASNNNIIQTITTGFLQLNTTLPILSQTFTIGCQTVGSVARIDVLGEILGSGTPTPILNTFSFSQNNANPPILPVNIELVVASPTYVAGRTAELKSKMVATYQPDAVGTPVDYIMTAEDSVTGEVLNSRKRSFSLPVLLSDSIRNMNLNIPDELNHPSIKVAWVIDNPAGGSFTPVQFQTLILETVTPPPEECPPGFHKDEFDICIPDLEEETFSTYTQTFKNMIYSPTGRLTGDIVINRTFTGNKITNYTQVTKVVDFTGDVEGMTLQFVESPIDISTTIQFDFPNLIPNRINVITSIVEGLPGMPFGNIPQQFALTKGVTPTLEEKNPFTPLIVGALALGFIGSSLLDKKQPKRRKR